MARAPTDASPSPGPPGRAPILLPGFDRSEQLQLNFSSTPFGAAWLTKVYTIDEKTEWFRDHLFARFEDRRTQELKLREVRYGNNVTLLFRVCFWCSEFYGTPRFWPAISRGFSASPEMVESMVDTLVRARRVYRRAHSTERSASLFHSGATKAADLWIAFLDREMDRYRREAPPGGDAVFHKASKYFDDAKVKFRQSDSALMLSGWAHANKRRRSPSPNPIERYPSGKRRPDSRDFDRRHDSPPAPDGPPLLSPLTTELKILGAAKDAYQTPVSANSGMRQGESFSHQPPADGSNRITIRGCATQGSPKTPNTAQWSEGPAIEHAFPRQELEQTDKAHELPAAATVRVKFDLAGAAAKKQSAPLLNNTASTEGPRPMVKTPVPPEVDRISLLEKKLAETEERRVQDVENARAMIASLETKLSSAGQPVSDHRENIQILQDRVASLEAKLEVVVKAVTPTDDRKIKEHFASQESGMVAIDASSEGLSVSAVQNIADRLACLEGKLAADAPSKAQNDQEIWTKISQVEKRLGMIETKSDAKSPVRELDNRITTLEHRQETLLNSTERTVTANKSFVEAMNKRLSNHLSSLERQLHESEKLVATKTFVETNSKLLNNRLSSLERQLEAEKFKARKITTTQEMVERKPALEVQGLQPLKAVEVSKTHKSPTPPREVQRNMEDMLERIKGLPTMSSISEKTFQVEKSLRDIIEKHQRDMKERWEAVTKDLDTAKAQIKGLVHLLNATTSDMATRCSVKTLEGELTILSKRIDVVMQSQVPDGHVARLEHKVDELTRRVGTDLQDITPTDLTTNQGAKEPLAIEVASLRDRVDTLNHSLTELVRQLTENGC